jgi:hypothetical protein
MDLHIRFSFSDWLMGRSLAAFFAMHRPRNAVFRPLSILSDDELPERYRGEEQSVPVIPQNSVDGLVNRVIFP